MAYLNPFATYFSSTWCTKVVFRVWDSISDAKLDVQSISPRHPETFTPPNSPPNTMFEMREALVQHFTYKDYARCWTSFTNSANDAIHHVLRVHNRRGGKGFTYISAIRTDIIQGRCLLQGAQETIAEHALDLSHHTTHHGMYEHEVLLSGTVPDEAIIGTFAWEGSVHHIAAAVRKWMQEQLDQHARKELGLGPMNPFASMVNLWQE
jgi:hypothetical protein